MPDAVGLSVSLVAEGQSGGAVGSSVSLVTERQTGDAVGSSVSLVTESLAVLLVRQCR